MSDSPPREPLTPERYVGFTNLSSKQQTVHPRNRRSFISTACGSDRELLNDALGLLAAHEALQSGFPPVPGLGSSGRVDPAVPRGLASVAPSPDRFVSGQVLGGRYRIVASAGKGGMGEVFRADDLELGQSVALKFLSPALAVHPEAVEVLRNEARVASQVTHHNVAGSTTSSRSMDSAS